MPNPDASVTAAAASSDGVVKICGSATFSIVATRGDDDRMQTELHRLDASGKRMRVHPPAEMEDYGPVALGCTTAANGDAYLVVEYGAVDGHGCAFCEWVYLYDANGKQLTSSVPPILKDPSLPGTQQQYPNSKEYEAMLKQLGLKHPELAYRP